MAERMAFGVYLKRGVRISKVSITTSDITTFETDVWQPAIKFTAEREKEPAKNEKKIEKIVFGGRWLRRYILYVCVLILAIYTSRHIARCHGANHVHGS